MKILVNKTGETLTVQLAFATLSIELDNIQDTIKSFESLANFILPEDQQAKDLLATIKSYHSILEGYLSAYSSLNFNSELEYSRKDNTIHCRNFKIEDYTIDLNVLKNLASKL